MKQWLLIFALLGQVALAGSTNGSISVDPTLPTYLPAAEVTGELVFSGPDTMEGVGRLWIAEFNKLQPKSKISYFGKMVTPVDRSALGPNTDEVFANTSAPYGEKYLYEPFFVQVAMGSYNTPHQVQAVGVYVNAANPLDRITLTQLDAIYSRERRRGHPNGITTWGDLGLTGEWEDQPIRIYGRTLRDEVAWHFKHVVMFDGAFRTGYVQPGKGTSVDIIDRLGNDPYGIAYSGFTYQTDMVKALALAGPDGVYVSGSNETIANGTYPLSRPLYLYVNRVPGRPLSLLTREFLLFVLSKRGQELVMENKAYLPMPADLVTRERAKLE
ncbi:MAG: substrate-binding domain-containing protein [Opitutaceae bacterium]|nr:substrate-binding domain-containing protein [Opitutaceae bacterium]